jgi:hypothetical protein
MVIGVFKCGTSALYHLLESHPNLYGGEWKEFCYFPSSNTNPTSQDLKMLWYFITRMQKNTQYAIEHYARHTTSGGLMIYSGCINLQANQYFHDLIRQPDTQYIVTVRDMSDFLWAVYNYW